MCCHWGYWSDSSVTAVIRGPTAEANAATWHLPTTICLQTPLLQEAPVTCKIPLTRTKSDFSFPLAFSSSVSISYWMILTRIHQQGSLWSRDYRFPALRNTGKSIERQSVAGVQETKPTYVVSKHNSGAFPFELLCMVEWAQCGVKQESTNRCTL